MAAETSNPAHGADTQTLATVLEHEEGARDRALLALQTAERQLEQARAQATQLVQYRADYIARWSVQFSRPAAIEIVQCYRGFMQRLDQAVAQQHMQVQRSEGTAQHTRAALQAAELRVAAVQKLIERRHEEHRRRSTRREQKQSDESAQQTQQARKAGWAASGGPGDSGLAAFF